jgi:hypothetical protein
MGIPGLITETMIYKNPVTIAEELELHNLHYTVTGSIDRIARLESEVYTRMTF